MRKHSSNPNGGGRGLGRIALEIAIYALFVLAYYFLVLHFMGGWLKRLFDENKPAYAVVALALMVTQGLGLDLLTGWLFPIMRKKTR
jgi:hypothetical protein